MDGPGGQTGKKCLLAQGVRRGGPVSTIRGAPGRYLLAASYMMPMEKKDQRVELNVSFKDDNGRSLSPGLHRPVTKVRLAAGKWMLTRKYGFDGIDVRRKPGTSSKS